MEFDAHTWEQRRLGDLGLLNPRSKLPNTFRYIDLESVSGTELTGYSIEEKASAPSRAQRLACYGDLFYQSVRPYQKNNLFFEIADGQYVFSTGYIQLRPHLDGYFLLCLVQNQSFVREVMRNCTGTSYPAISANDFAKIEVLICSSRVEFTKISGIFRLLDTDITLHQRQDRRV